MAIVAGLWGPLGPVVVKGKVSCPGTEKEGTGRGKRPEWGASPAKPCEASPL